MSVDIVSLVSNNDGVSASATVAGTQNGSLTFIASRTPDFTTTHNLSYTGSNPYSLVFPAPVGWYVTANDTDGASPAYPVWVSLNYKNNISAFQDKLRSVLLSNGPLIMQSVSEWYPNATLKSVAVNAFSVTSFPALIVDNPAWSTNYRFMPFGLEHVFSCDIFCCMKYSDEDIGVLQCSQMAMAVASILNSPPYETVTLDNGLVVNFCYCANGKVGAMKLTDSTGWLMTGQLRWSGLSLTQEAPGL